MKPSEILEAHIPELRKIMEKNEHFCNLRVFGSVANGTDTEDSDIDFLVESTGRHGLFALFELRYQLEDLLNVKIDLVDEKTLRPTVRKTLTKIIPI